ATAGTTCTTRGRSRKRPGRARRKAECHEGEAVTNPLNQSPTLLDALTASLAAATRSPEGVAEPVALLWTDADGQWRPLVPGLQKACAHFYVLGAYDAARLTGPAIWLKCVVDRTLPDLAPPP